MTDLPPIATHLREARLAAGLSQNALTRRTGIATSIISTIENGHVSPGPAMLDTLVDALALDRDQAYHIAGRVPPEIVAALAADLPLVRELRERLGL